LTFITKAINFFPLIKIATLSNQSLPTLVRVFNEAFSDYAIPVKITEEQLAEKIYASNIRLDLSPGAFIDGELVGFIWHGVGKQSDQPIVWNGGTGVIPSQRGQRLTTQLYDFILPKLKERGYERTVLEVIIGNEPAVRTYQKKGFRIIRTLDCFRGRIEDPTVGVINGVDRRILQKPIQWSAIHELHAWRPTFQNSDERIDLMEDLVKGIGLFAEEQLIGYILFDARWDYGDVYQFGVRENFRRQGIGKYLFSIAQRKKTVPLKIINVDTDHQASVSFFNALGFERIIGQFEMLKEI
jgi:ribosomal protein S18 acetylase RimI-like enzyme